MAMAAFPVLRPTCQGFILLASPFKVLVPSTIQILIQLRRRRLLADSFAFPRLPSYRAFFYFLQISRSAPLLPPAYRPAKSEFNYDPSRSRFLTPSARGSAIRGLSRSHICRLLNAKSRLPFLHLPLPPSFYSSSFPRFFPSVLYPSAS